MKYWFDSVPKEWTDAIPIGNGLIGGMVYGNVQEEQLQLNEETLWSGSPYEMSKDSYVNEINETRDIIARNDYVSATEYTRNHLGDRRHQTFLPAGTLHIDSMDPDCEVTAYQRGLDLDTGVVHVQYTTEKHSVKREAFCSHAAKVMVYHYEVTDGDALNLLYYMDCQLPHSKRLLDERYLLNGLAPSHKDSTGYLSEMPLQFNPPGIEFCALLHVDTDGEVNVSEKGLEVTNARNIMLKITLSTNHIRYDHKPNSLLRDPLEICSKQLDEASQYTYEQLKEHHIADYQSLYKSMELHITHDDQSHLPLDKRIQLIKDGQRDIGLQVLLFNYGRYLMISSSREDSREPANLQGIWNSEIHPPWNSSYVLNINQEMSYWMSHSTNLFSCGKPLIKFIKEIVESGQKVAKAHGTRGFITYSGTDLWRKTTQGTGYPRCFFWPFGGVWISRYIWEHYLYTQDENFLRGHYYVLKEATLFCLDWLVDGEDGIKYTSPSTSPENQFYDDKGENFHVAKASTMDTTLIWELFDMLEKCADILDLANEADFIHELSKTKAQLLPYRIDKLGRLQEWDEDYAEQHEGHRHFSHLCGVYPGTRILEKDDPEYMIAAENSLNHRIAHNSGKTSWSCAWTICLYARMNNSEKVQLHVDRFLENSIYNNLFSAHPPFQIDGNFGFVAGVSESLLQSHQGYIDVFPAIPLYWHTGHVKGLKARGDITIDIAWCDGQVTHINVYRGKNTKGKSIMFLLPNPCELVYEGKTISAPDGFYELEI